MSNWYLYGILGAGRLFGLKAKRDPEAMSLRTMRMRREMEEESIKHGIIGAASFYKSSCVS